MEAVPSISTHGAGRPNTLSFFAKRISADTVAFKEGRFNPNINGVRSVFREPPKDLFPSVKSKSAGVIMSTTSRTPSLAKDISKDLAVFHAWKAGGSTLFQLVKINGRLTSRLTKYFLVLLPSGKSIRANEQ